ncbi:MAG: HAD family hydrolase [Thermoguttaceae bacterium]|nr:HAD family hydrolase [Thermoguttaceae bacterium]
MITITPKHEFFIGIDSDGCAFDTMELKHKECFIPNTISYWGMQGVSKYAREANEFVNLYSKTRGCNRVPALRDSVVWLNRRPEVIARGIHIELPQSLLDWMERENKLGNAALMEEVRRTNDPGLKRALEWSLAVNDAVTKIVHGVPPFPFVRESLEKLSAQGDIMVVSATPNEALEREWAEHDIAKYTVVICGQEYGTKKEMLVNANQYAPNKSLMIGDAPGDYKAAKANNTLFYPINPGAEEASWKRFFEEGADKFFNGTFAGEYQQTLLAEFETFLPELPPWKVV